MQIILLEKVANLGNLGDVVKVKDGYARNFLIPTRQARRATASALKEFEVKRAELEKAAAEKLAAAQVLADSLTGKMGFAINKSQIRMPLGALKAVGEFPVNVAAHTDVVVEVTVQVVPEAA